MEHKGPMVGEHPPRLKADPAEDPWHEDYVQHRERWVGAGKALRAKGFAGLESAMRALWAGEAHG